MKKENNVQELLNDAISRECRIHNIKLYILNSNKHAVEAIKDAIRTNRFEDITREDVEELLNWSGVKSVTVDDILKREMITMGDIDCPRCGKTLVRLDEECNGKSVYWCDECNLDIEITDGDYDYHFEDAIMDLVGEDNYNEVISAIEEIFVRKDIERNEYIDDKAEDTGKHVCHETVCKDDNAKSILKTACYCSNIDFKECPIEIRINFGKNRDQTSFDVSSFEELLECWIGFCNDNKLDICSTKINFVKALDTPKISEPISVKELSEILDEYSEYISSMFNV